MKWEEKWLQIKSFGKAFAVITADWEGAVLSLNLFDVICENKVLCLLWWLCRQFVLCGSICLFVGERERENEGEEERRGFALVWLSGNPAVLIGPYSSRSSSGYKLSCQQCQPSR